MNNKNYLVCNFINGLGNHIFIYTFAKLLSKINNIPVYHDAIPTFGIESNKDKFRLIKDNGLETIKLNEINWNIRKINLDKNKNYMIIYLRELENFRIYRDFLPSIRELFRVDKFVKNKDDLVIHFRAGNDFLSEIFFSIPEPESYDDLLSNIEFKNLYIVTNCDKTDNYSLKDYEFLKNKLKTNGGDGDNIDTYNRGNYPWASKYITDEQALVKINGIFEVFNKYNPIWINTSQEEDFKFLCKFEKIVIAPSTFSWWAAVLSNPKIVYSYKPWKNVSYVLFDKEDKKRNLGKCNYENWHHWGDIDYCTEKYFYLLYSNHINKIKVYKDDKFNYFKKRYFEKKDILRNQLL